MEIKDINWTDVKQGLGHSDITRANAYNISDDVILADNLQFMEQQAIFKINIVIILFCTNGKMRIEVNDKSYTLVANNLLICPPNFIVGHYMTSPDFECKALCMTMNVATQMLMHHEQDIWNKFLFVRDNPIIKMSDFQLEQFNHFYPLLKLMLEYNTQSFYGQKSVWALIQSGLYGFIDRMISNDNNQEDNSGRLSQGDLLFKRFFDLLTTNVKKERSVFFYADKLYVTPKYLSAVCKKVTGKTASTWISDMVVNEVKTMLTYSDKSIKEICNEFEFASLSFFGKYVKAHLGVSPTEFRRQLRRPTE